MGLETPGLECIVAMGYCYGVGVHTGGGRGMRESAYHRSLGLNYLSLSL